MQHTAHVAVAGILLALSSLAAGTAAADDSEICRVQSGQVAIEACNRAIRSSSSTKQQVIDAYINRGQEYFTLKDYDRALADFNIAAEMGPNESIAFGNRANCWYAKNDYSRAIVDYTRAIGIDPNYTASYTGRGLSHEALGDKDKARADYRAALSVPQKNQDGQWAHNTAREHLQALGDN